MELGTYECEGLCVACGRPRLSMVHASAGGWEGFHNYVRRYATPVAPASPGEFIWCASCGTVKSLGTDSIGGVPVNVWAWLGIHGMVGCAAAGPVDGGEGV